MTTDELLYPPELWAVLSPSAVAALSQRSIALALGDGNPMTEPNALWELAVTETTPVQAAYLMSDARAVDLVDQPWTDDDIQSWWVTAASERSLDQLWMASALAKQRNIGLPVSDEVRRLVDEAVAGTDMWPQRMAESLSGSVGVSGAAAGEANNLRDSNDAASMLRWEAEHLDQDPDKADSELVRLAWQAARDNDVARADLVRAYATVGDSSRAHDVAATIDGRRLLEDGDVLEPVLFNGSVGSSFRMVLEYETADEPHRRLSQNVEASIAAATTERLHVDVSHEMAGTALLAMLDPSTSTAEEREAMVREAMESELGNARSQPLSLEQAFTWIALTEYATAMGVEVSFPGVSDEAVAAWTAEEPKTTALSISRLIMALDGNSGSSVDQVPQALVDQLEGALSSTPIEDLDSLTLFGGFAALQAVGIQALPDDVVVAELQRRRGSCLGGFQDYVRDTRAADGPCNVDSTRFATLALKEIQNDD